MKYLKTYSDKCTGCGTCMTVCSTLYFKEDNPARSRIQIEDRGNDNYFINVCKQDCRHCVTECPTMALTVNKFGVVIMHKNLCVGCLACVAACPTDSMRYFESDPTPFKCIACGSCAKECPEEALELIIKED